MNLTNKMNNGTKFLLIAGILIVFPINNNIDNMVMFM